MDCTQLSYADISALIRCKAYLTVPGLAQSLLDRWCKLDLQSVNERLPCPLDKSFWAYVDPGLLESDDDEQIGEGARLRSGRVAGEDDDVHPSTSIVNVDYAPRQPSTSASVGNFSVERDHEKLYSKRSKLHCE